MLIIRLGGGWHEFLGFQLELLGDKIHYLDDIGGADDHS